MVGCLPVVQDLFAVELVVERYLSDLYFDVSQYTLVS
jgi:hypothetical protein